MQKEEIAWNHIDLLHCWDKSSGQKAREHFKKAGKRRLLSLFRAEEVFFHSFWKVIKTLFFHIQKKKNKYKAAKNDESVELNHSLEGFFLFFWGFFLFCFVSLRLLLACLFNRLFLVSKLLRCNKLMFDFMIWTNASKSFHGLSLLKTLLLNDLSYRIKAQWGRSVTRSRSWWSSKLLTPSESSCTSQRSLINPLHSENSRNVYCTQKGKKIKLSSLLSRESFPVCTVRGVGEEALSEYVLLTWAQPCQDPNTSDPREWQRLPRVRLRGAPALFAVDDVLGRAPSEKNITHNNVCNNLRKLSL